MFALNVSPLDQSASINLYRKHKAGKIGQCVENYTETVYLSRVQILKDHRVKWSKALLNLRLHSLKHKVHSLHNMLHSTALCPA